MKAPGPIAIVSLMTLAGNFAFGQDIRPTRSVKIPMRDGVGLATDVYLPSPDAKRLPTLLIQTPYGKHNYNHEWGARAKRWGYAIVIQDMRGRFASEGKMMAFLDSGWGERQDGYDTVEWLARQAFSNGKVGTVGASAMGIAQNMMAPSAPPHLAAQYILVAEPSLYRAAYHGGVFRKALAERWLRDNGYPEENLREVLSRPTYDYYWENVDAAREAGRIRVPAIHYGGWFDIFGQGTIDSFLSRQKRGGKGAGGAQKLVIGPWLHGGPNATRIGDFELPENARSIPVDVSAKRWFDFYLKGEKNGADEIPAVLYYVMGPFDRPGRGMGVSPLQENRQNARDTTYGNEWRTAESWPPPSKATSFYLQTGGNLTREKPKEKDAHASYVYDPKNPVPTIGGANMNIEGGPKDQRSIEKRSDVLVFTSEALAERLEATGRVEAELWIASERKDTDFAVRLCDVYPDGRSILVCDGIQRCATRKSPRDLIPLEPGKPTRIRVDLLSTSFVFAPGHRVRILVSSSNHPRFEVNPNSAFSGKPDGTVLDATNTVFFEKSHPSRLILPMVKH